MSYFYGVVVVLSILLMIVLIWRWPQIRHRFRGWRKERLEERFCQQKTALQEEFFKISAASGKPRGLRWAHGDWGEEFLLARDRSCNGYVALMEVAIQFSAIEGGDMEDVPALALAKNATAIFFFEAGQWHTGGKAVYNLNPDEVVERFRAQYERL